MNEFAAFLSTSAKSLQSSPTLETPVDCSLPGFSVHGIFQAKLWSLTSPGMVGRFFTTSSTLPSMEVATLDTLKLFLQ